MSKQIIYPADTVDRTGVVFPTVGENIRNGTNGVAEKSVGDFIRSLGYNYDETSGFISISKTLSCSVICSVSPDYAFIENELYYNRSSKVSTFNVYDNLGLLNVTLYFSWFSWMRFNANDSGGYDHLVFLIAKLYNVSCDYTLHDDIQDELKSYGYSGVTFSNVTYSTAVDYAFTFGESSKISGFNWIPSVSLHPRITYELELI